MTSSPASEPAVEEVAPPTAAAPLQPSPAADAEPAEPRAPWRRRLARVVPVVRTLGYLAALAIVCVMAVKAVRDVDLSELAWWPLAPAFAATVAWWLLLARGWSLLSTGHPRRADVSTWCRTQSLRYLPGGIWAPVSRVAVVKGTILDRLSTVAAENVIALCAALALGGLALAASGELPWLALVAVIAVPVLAARFLVGRTRVDPARTLVATRNYLLAFIAYGLSAVLVQTAVSGLHDPLAVAGAAALAWGAGLVIVIAPGGIGVREAVYVALLVGSLPTAELAAAAVAMRVVAVIAELVVLVAAGRPAPQPAASAAAGGP